MTEITTNANLPIGSVPSAVPDETILVDAHSGHGAAESSAEKIRYSLAGGFASARAWLRRLLVRRMSRAMFRTVTMLGWIAVIAVAGYITLAAMMLLRPAFADVFSGDRAHHPGRGRVSGS